MSNKIQLQTNNASLDGYIARINAAKEVAAGLPAAGGGGASVEVWTGTVYGSSGLGDMPDNYVYYTDENLVNREIIVSPRTEATITIAANTYIVSISSFSPPSRTENDSEGCQIIDDTYTAGKKISLPLRDNFILTP